MTMTRIDTNPVGASEAVARDLGLAEKHDAHAAAVKADRDAANTAQARAAAAMIGAQRDALSGARTREAERADAMTGAIGGTRAGKLGEPDTF